jgi:hypothetical protein
MALDEGEWLASHAAVHLGKERVSIEYEVWWALEPVWMLGRRKESFVPA